MQAQPNLYSYKLPKLALRWYYPLIGFGLLLVVGILWFAIGKPIKVLPRGETIPGFFLVNQQGQRLSDWDTLDTITLYTIGYASCGATCQPSDQVFQQLQARIPAELSNVPIALVTISLDPNDTPQQLQQMAARVGANPTLWHFTTGKPDQVKSLVGGGFGIYYTVEQQSIQFEPGFVLVDGKGLIRAEYHTATPDIEILVRDLRLLDEEQRNNTGAGALFYEAAHLFVCYP